MNLVVSHPQTWDENIPSSILLFRGPNRLNLVQRISTPKILYIAQCRGQINAMFDSGKWRVLVGRNYVRANRHRLFRNEDMTCVVVCADLAPCAVFPRAPRPAP